MTSTPATIPFRSQYIKYYKYEDEGGIVGDGTRYIESDDGVALREVTVIGDKMIGSNVKYPLWGLMLAEGETAYDEISCVERIDPSEFESVWSLHLKSNAGRWAMTKAAYPVAKKVAGFLKVFFPQGAIVDLGDGVLGVANYTACKSSTTSEYICGHLITAVVSGYDEQYQWLILHSPQVHPERPELFL
jgi:hypothetical protein